MIRQEDFVKIETMAGLGMYYTDIAEQLGVNEKTVRRALKRGSAPKRERAKRGSKLAGYEAKVDGLLNRGVWNGAVILREIQADGYSGGRTVLRNYIRPKRALRMTAGRATVRFETEPGVQLQSDWGTVRVEIGGEEREVKFCVNTLGYSRRFHFWCTNSEDAEHTYEGIQRSFEYFGGVTHEVLLDNQKAAVYCHRRGEAATFQVRFEDFAGHMGFKAKACQPYRARTKGKDERMVGYIKGNFFVRYQAFESFAHLNQQAEQWLSQEADQRQHGTVHEVVAVRFGREQPSLKALPGTRYDTAYRQARLVSWDGYIEVRGNRYSVPSQWVGQSMLVRIGLDERVRVFFAECCVAEHVLQERAQGWVTVAAHHAALWQQTRPVAPVVEQRPLAVYQEAVTAWS